MKKQMLCKKKFNNNNNKAKIIQMTKQILYNKKINRYINFK